MRIAFNPSTVAALTSPPDNKDITFDLRGHNIFARGVKFCGTDTNTWRDIKINNVSIDSNTLDLRDGDNTTLTNINGVVTINSTWRPVVDNLTSDSTTSSLSANQGRVLAGLINGKSDSDHNHDDRYLRLTGGWMLGDINFGGDNRICWGRNTDSASISFKNDGDGDADSYMSFVTSDNGNEYFRWSHSSGSTNTEWMSLRSDGLRVGGTKVSLEGHTHDDRYVKRSGDTMLGALNFANGTWNLVGDDSYMGDCNISGHFGIKAANTIYPGIAFFNNSGTHLGNLTAYSGNIKYGAHSLQFLDNGNTSVSAGTWMNPFSDYNSNAVADGQAICVWGQSSYLGNLASDSGDMSLWLKRVNANVATLNMVLDGEYYANGNQRLAHVSEIPNSLKNPYTLTISLNGTSQGPYDGSAAKNINITPSSIGAATSGHNHINYLSANGLISGNIDNIWTHGTYGFGNRSSYTGTLPGNSSYGGFLVLNPNATTTGTYCTTQIALLPGYFGYRIYDDGKWYDWKEVSMVGHNHDGHYVRYYAVTTLDCNNLAVGLTAAGVSATNAAHTNHSAFLYISDVGTPFQIQIPDSSVPYIYKRYYSSGTWSGWFKLNAGYADSAGSVAWDNVTGKPTSFTPSSHTHSWASITDKIVAGNEFNIVNAGFTDDMFFNYLPINDRSKTAKIACYHFGNGATGYASIKASGFIKLGSSSSYVLLGDGGHQTISSLSVNYANSAGNADTVDGYHATSGRTFNGNINWSPNWNDTWSDGTNNHPWYGFDHRYPNTEAYSTTITDYFGMTIKTANTLRLDFGTLLLNGTDIHNINIASATKLATARSIWGQSFDGTSDVNGTIYINNSNSSNGAIRLNNNINSNARISAIDDQVIFNTSNAIRFGETSWDWNQWAGLKYTHSNKTIYLGIADNSIFNANSAQGGGTLKFPGITTITTNPGARIGNSGGDLYLGNANNSAWLKVQDICSHNGSDYWYIYQNGNATFNYIKSKTNAYIVGNLEAGQIIRGGSGQMWVNGRNGALLRETSVAGYHTLWSLKTTNGSWDFGEYNAGSDWDNVPVLSYITDSNYNSGNNTPTYQIRFPLASGTVALTSNIPNPTNYYWANVKISTSSSTTTSPIVSNLTATSSIRMGNISLEHTDEINSASGLHLNYRTSNNVTLCYGGGKVGIGTGSPSYKLDINGQMRASGFHHESVNSDNYILLAGGGYTSFGGDSSHPIFLGYLNLDHGNDGTISSSFYCLGYSVSFTYTRGGNYCKIYIPDTSYQTFYIRAATASVNYSGGGMDTWVGTHRGNGAWWLHCYASGTNEVRVKGFCQNNSNNDSWWGGNPLGAENASANKITVCIFGYVTFK